MRKTAVGEVMKTKPKVRWRPQETKGARTKIICWGKLQIMHKATPRELTSPVTPSPSG